MPPEAAVADPPANAPAPNEAPPNGEGTVPDGKTSQADPKNSEANAKPNGDGAPAPTGEEPKPGEGEETDPVKKAIADGIEAWKAENLESELAAREAQKAEEQREAQTEADFTAEFNTAIKEISASLKGIVFEGKDDAGQPVKFTLNDEQIQRAVHDRLNAMRGKVRGMEESMVYGDLADEAVKLLGGDKEKVDAFVKAAGGKPIGEWLKAAVEHAAPTSDWAKKQERDHKAALSAEYARGWEDKAKAPPGQVSMQNTKNVNSGMLTKPQWDAMTPLERADAVRDRKAEVDALIGQ